MQLEAKASFHDTGTRNVEGQTISPQVVAAIALALELEGSAQPVRIPADRGTSQWALAGRGRVLRGR